MEKSKQQSLAHTLVALIAVVFILYVLKPAIVPIIFAIILAVLVYPFVSWLERRLRFNKALAAIFGIIVICCVAGVLIYFVVFQFNEFAEKKDEYYTRIMELYGNVKAYISEQTGIEIGGKGKAIKLEDLAQKNSPGITSAFGYFTGFVADMFLMPIYMFFMMYYREFFLEFIYRASKKTRAELDIILKKIYGVVQSYLLGLVTVMGIVGALNSLGLFLLGIENAIFFGFLGAVLLLIPYIGIFIGSALPALVALITKDSAWYAAGVIAVFGFVQILEGNFITPNITGSRISMNPFISVFSLVLFAMLWGMAGMVLALPITAILKIIFDHKAGMEPYGFLIGEAAPQYVAKEKAGKAKSGVSTGRQKKPARKKS